MQYRHFILVIGFSALIATDLKAQWEKLPLYSGHADYLVQNKYKRNEVFAVVKRGGIYGSTDYGNIWRAIVDDKDQLGWVTDISDFDVTDDGSYFVYANSALWKSKDTGRSWIKISDKFPSGFGNIESHEDGAIFLLVTGDNPYILRSSNYGATWDTLHLNFQDSYRIRNYFVSPAYSRFILLYGTRGALRISVDGGLNWEDISFISQGYLQNPVIYQSGTQAVLGIWLNVPPEFNYFESRDTGKSWIKINNIPILYPDAGGLTDNRAFHDSSGLMMKTILNNLYMSKDYGSNIKLIANYFAWDVVKPFINIYCSILLDGLRESSDTGGTWKTFRGSRQYPGFSRIDFSFLSKDTMFAATRELYYTGGKPRWVSLLMQSNDGGEHWFDVLKTETIGGLRTSSSPESKYVLVSNSNMLVCGRPGQASPDTLLATVGDIVQFEISKPSPMDMYVVVNQNGGYTYHFSTDAGASWTRAAVPPFNYDEVTLYPSLIERGKFFAVTHSQNPLDIYGLGLWVGRNYGERWELTYPTPDLLGSLVRITGNDLIFNVSLNKFSSDEGRTWYADTTGMDGNDWTEFVSNGYERYSTSKGLVIANNRSWYIYGNGGWMKLRDETGAPISRTLPAGMDFAGSYLYCGREYNGLYRILAYNSTGVQTRSADDSFEEILAYPNPFMDHTTISYKLCEAQNVTVRITNLLGETIYNREVTEKAGDIIVDGRIIPGEAFNSGIYLVTFYRLGIPIKSISLIMLR